VNIFHLNLVFNKSVFCFVFYFFMYLFIHVQCQLSLMYSAKVQAVVLDAALNVILLFWLCLCWTLLLANTT